MKQPVDSTNLLSLLENAPGNPLIWVRFLTQLSQLLNCDSSALLIIDLLKRENTHFRFTANISQKYQELYINKLNKLDSFNYLICKNPRQVFYNEPLKNSYTIENDSNFINPDDQNYRFGISIPCTPNHSFNLIINRKKELNKIDQQRIIKNLQPIITPLEEALHAEQRHKINSQLIQYLGDHFDGYIIVDSDLEILFSDPFYTSIISQYDCVKISENKLSMTNRFIEQQLLALITKNEEGQSIYNQCHPCQITIIPVSSLKNLYQWECYKNGFILTFTYYKDKNLIIDRLIDIYKLSRCEAICALHFMKTPSISHVAINTFRSQETVRNHIKHTMQKMDVHNQAELMKKLITLVAL